MFYDPFGTKNNSSRDERKNAEDTLIQSEMCDVCGHSFHCSYIRRVQMQGKLTGTMYTFRLCPYCNPSQLLEIL